jgi:hypothetical protein
MFIVTKIFNGLKSDNSSSYYNELRNQDTGTLQNTRTYYVIRNEVKDYFI